MNTLTRLENHLYEMVQRGHVALDFGLKAQLAAGFQYGDTMVAYRPR